MKRLVILLLMICPMLASAQTVSNVQNSGCLSETRGAESQRVPTIILTKEGSTLSVQLLDYESDCCTEDFNVTFSIASGSNYDVCEVSISPISEDCDCVCPYNVSFTVRDLAPNEFYLYCWWYKGMVNLTEGEPLVLEYKVMTEDVMINETNFPDENFRNYLLSQKYGKDGVLTEEEIAEITKIEIPPYSECKNLQGIEFFTALKELDCHFTLVTSLDMSNNTELQSLTCYVSGIETLNVSNNKKLSYLNCSDTKLTSLDVSGCTALNWLACEENELTELDVSKNTALERLICYDNQLTSLNVSGCTALTRINCGDNQLTSLDVSGCTALTDLYCSKNKIKGEAMDALIESLPIASNSHIYVINNNEQNVMTTTQVAAAKAKGWIPYYTIDNSTWIEYAGSEPTPQDDYHPLLEEGKAWTYHYHGYNGREFNVGRIIDGDTIISGQAYKKIYDKVGGQYQYALREKGKKVYMVDDHYETESLLYDFSKDAGDVIDELVYPLIVASVDTIDIDGVKFRRMRVQDANQPVEEWDDEMINMYNFWIEGVGSECLLESSIRGNGNYYNLLSCQINGRVYTQQELLATNPKKIGLDQYLPFVQAEKKWTVNQLYVGKENLDEMTYTLSYDEVSENGNQYYPMSRSLNGNLVDDEPVLIREKNRRVYLHFPYTEYEYLLFDYSLKKGDTYWTYSLDERKAVKYEVLSVSDFTEGPEFVYREYDEKGDSMKTCVRYLRKWVVERTDMPIQKTWIEGVGSLEGPLANFYDAARNSGRDYLAYVELGVGDYLPFEFYDTVTHQWHGCNLPTGAEDNWDEDFHKLTYELEGDRLHIYGEALTQCAPNNYAYFKEEPTEDPLTYRIRFYIQEVEPMVDCMALHATNFYVSGFNPNLNYIVVDNQGVEHPVINRTPQDDYRQFVEEGKVWKVGVWSGNPVQMVEYFYFDGDTIVDGKECKWMWCQQYANEGSWCYNTLYRHEDPYKPLFRIGAFYEEDKKVYFQPWEDQLGGLYANDLWLLYDFSVMPGDTIFDYVMTAKASGGMPEFKGTYYDLTPYTEPKEYEEPLWNNRWLEGVGRADVPYYNLYNGETGHYTFLMSCTVGDEVIYLNDEYEDGATPSMETKKRRFDFTHTVKIQPKTPSRRGEEAALYGEYNDKSLDIRLDPLDEAYSVCITNQKTGETLYEKNINAGSIVALNIDISKYPEGQYKISIDNSNETFNGVFDTTATGINEIVNGKWSNSKSIYNLQGQRINGLQKGLNIVDGKKILVK